MAGLDASHPSEALRRIAFFVERTGGPAHRSRTFRRAASVLEGIAVEELRELSRKGRLQQMEGIGPVTAGIVAEVLEGKEPSYLAKLEEEAGGRPTIEGDALYSALRGDCHVHSNWSDGRASIREMAKAAIALGRDYMVLTDHSPRLKIANGLTTERLVEELEVVRELNLELTPFRVLSGIEVDILEDGSLDQTDEVLSYLDVVVASVHSLLRQDSAGMTKRLLAALANPHLDILGHCTGRMRRSRGDRPESTFDHERVFAQAAAHDKAIEVNCQLARQDPPERLIRLAVDLGCWFSIDSDAHAPGELEWTAHGALRGVENGVTAERVVNTQSADELLEWTAAHEASGAKQAARVRS